MDVRKQNHICSTLINRRQQNSFVMCRLDYPLFNSVHVLQRMSNACYLPLTFDKQVKQCDRFLASLLLTNTSNFLFDRFL